MTDPEDRNLIREELPLSTRVHELAKELGLKSAELLERIQNWGLDVKASNFASLDPVTVDRIRELSGQSARGRGPTSAPSGARSAPAHRSPPPAVSPGPPARGSSMEASATKSPGTAPVSPARPRSEPAASGSQLLAPGSSPAAAPVRSVGGIAPAIAPGGAPAAGAQMSCAGNGWGAAGVRVSPATFSSRWFHRLASRRRPAFGAHSASRNRHPPRLARALIGWPAGAAIRTTELVGRIDHRRRARRLPALETGRLHVIGGHSHDDSAREPRATSLFIHWAAA